MCGISLVVDQESGEGLVESLRAMHAAIPHRGPDGEGFCVLDGDWRLHAAREAAALPLGTRSARVGCAFRWLQIQDRDPASSQPMASADGAIQLLFNGEIYNFRELREELARAGRPFRTRSDTEVVLAAYEHWGEAAFARFEGMWALAILDLRDRSLVISRDRFGIKPLYLHRAGSRLFIASEVKQLLAAGAPARADRSSVTRFLRGRRPSPPEATFFEGIRAQPPATWARIPLDAGAGEPQFRAYWDLPKAPPDMSIKLEAACERLDAILARSVSDHLVAAVPVGILVSGGLDSSLVAALSARSRGSSGERIDAYSMVPERASRDIDESAYMTSVVNAFGLRGHATTLAPATFKQAIGAVTRAQEEPAAGFAAAAQYAVFALAATQGTRVVLDGQGADEIFAGYPRHQFAYLADRASRGHVLEAAIESGAVLAADRGFARDLWRGTVLPRARRLLPGRAAPPPVFLRAPFDRPMARQPLSLADTLRRDVLEGNLRAVLALTDRNAMAHSIEARVPYVHRPVVEFAFSLPDRFKIGAGQRKRVLRALGERYLPPEVARRRDRIGFGAPTRDWLSRDFVTELRALANGPAFAASECVDREGVHAFVERFLAGAHRDAGTAWRLYAVDQWVRTFSVTGL